MKYFKPKDGSVTKVGDVEMMNLGENLLLYLKLKCGYLTCVRTKNIEIYNRDGIWLHCYQDDESTTVRKDTR